MKTKIYKIKKLIDGAVIGKEGWFVAVPDKGFKDGKVIVEYIGKHMTIKNWHKAEAFRYFHDKFGGKDYLLGYFFWVPDIKQELHPVFKGNTAII